MSGGIIHIASPDARVTEILSKHVQLMRDSSPEESCHVLPPEAVFDGESTVLAWQEGDTLLAVGALKPFGEAQGELKSMHTLAAARGRGIAAAVLQALLDAARTQGLSRVNLETGSDDLFAPARRLYERFDFTYCPPFGEYVEDPLSVFMTVQV